MPMGRDLGTMFSTVALRSFGTGLLGVVLGVYLYREGATTAQIGIILAVGLAGIAAATVLSAVYADRFGRRRMLAVLSLLSSIAGIALALHTKWMLLPAAFIGMLNGTGTDRSAPYALEQAIVPALVSERGRTWAFSWYNVTLDASGALGALTAGLPLMLSRSTSRPLSYWYSALFLGFAGLNVLNALLYTRMSNKVESAAEVPLPMLQAVSPKSRRTIAGLAGLFSIDSFAGGFLTDALVSFWFFQRFGVSEAKLGVLFFTVRVLNALSHLAAAWLAQRIGLLRTMVLTHLPSNLFLMAVPFAPSLKMAALLFLAREALVEMDVPTRQSYVVAVVEPEARTVAAGATNLVRTAGWGLGSAFAGSVMQAVSFSAPLLFGGGLKIVYDVLLFFCFRKVKPPEER